MFEFNFTPRRLRRQLCAAVCCVAFTVGFSFGVASAEVERLTANGSTDASQKELNLQFKSSVTSFLKSYCYDCHSTDFQEAKLDLQRFAAFEDVIENHQLWAEVLLRLEKQEMPPEEAEQPTTEERQKLIDWIQAVRKSEAMRNAGDPGPVTARRLSNAEYNYTIRDLTGVDLQPTKEFPVDPANEAGFDNSAESLTMSPALFNKYLAAARHVAEHLVLKPDGFDFAPHQVVANTDRDKYCVKRIVQFYQQQPTNLADYFYAAWEYQNRAALGKPGFTLSQVAKDNSVSPKYLKILWLEAIQEPAEIGPLATLQQMWAQLPKNADQSDLSREHCERMRDWVNQLRTQLAPQFDNLEIEGVHKGSQSFVLWKNRQYASSRQNYDGSQLITADDAKPDAAPDPDLVIPGETERSRYEAAFAKFCRVFPDAFYISERGRDYLGKAKDQQEKGRLLSAGFHSMMGYFRDDQPLYDLILSESQQRQLDGLWQELDFIAAAPSRQYSGFLWFERTDSRYMRDPEFDFARPENKESFTEENIEKLAEIYLDKARRSGGEEVAINAIIDYFQNINRQIRWVEQSRLAAEPRHLDDLLDFAERAYRRKLAESEQDELLSFYALLRDEGASHEESVQDTIVSILVSPYFSYRMDLLNASGDSRALTDEELASRLSYFLWASMPDQELMDLAAAGELHQPDVLTAQAQRMLKDDRIRGLATEFAGNWLDFRRFQEHNSVDRERFPEFTDELRQAMFEEPIRFFIDLAQHDRPVIDCLYSERSIVNEPLAEHYGLDNYDSERGGWQRINVSDQQRGGLLTMPVFLTQNSPGLRTSPVKRGYWVVRRLLGETIPPPPPNVPDIPNEESKFGDRTLAEVLASHREHKSCAVCHDRFDAFGLAFENFGPVGELRTVDLGGRPIETQVTFPGDVQGKGLPGLQDYLRDHRQRDFLDNLCRKLLTYALGRTLLLSDEPLVEQMRVDLESNETRFGILIESIITSPQFLNKRGSQHLAKE